MPAAVINVAAYTAVDLAESEPALAFAVNRDGAASLAAACAGAGVPLVHVSTDYVFDGLMHGAYVEEDAPGPAGVYGASKLAGEEAVALALPSAHLVVRTSWVFSHDGSNFVRTIWRLAREREVIRVVADQRGNPTPAADLAGALVTMAQALLADPGVSGLYHWVGTPPTTWHGLAEAVVDEARRRGPVATRVVEAITTADYPTAAARPQNAVLDTSKAQRVFGIEPPDWRISLSRVADLLSSAAADAGLETPLSAP
jgi:dTDP-4-dehydrorhamnose reductase